MKLTTLSLVAVLLASCSPASGPVAPVDQPDAARAPSCASACTNLRAQKCKLGEPTSRGATCETYCQGVQTNNAGAGFNVVCLSSVKSCGEAEACR